jgi:SAM-dependent methyltransferase
MSDFLFACPVDRTVLSRERAGACCPTCGVHYPRREKIWRFADVSRDDYRDFLETYRVVRRAEGWGSPDARYYQTLPYVARDDAQYAIWRVRAVSFQKLVTLLSPASTLLDVGAGNGWLSYQLLQRGHSVATLDLNDDERDGLGAQHFYPTALECVQADMQQLPFADAQFDAVIFNASLHYTTDLARALAESLRVLKARGAIVVTDSPLYRQAASGAAMLQAKAREFQTKYGLEMARTPRGFLTFADFQHPALHWQWYESFADARARVVARAWGCARQWSARWRGKHEPARFGVMVGQRVRADDAK